MAAIRPAGPMAVLGFHDSLSRHLRQAFSADSLGHTACRVGQARLKAGCLGEFNLLDPLARLIVSLPPPMRSVYKRRQKFCVGPTGELSLPLIISYLKAQLPETGLRIALPKSFSLPTPCKLP